MIKQDFMKFTERLNEVLKQNKMKQTDIAKACNVSRQNITNWKTGTGYPSIDTLYRLCKYLDVSSDYLLGLSDD